MIIRELKQTSPEHFTLIFDNGGELKTTLGVITERYIHSGLELDEELFEALSQASALALAKERAMRILGARPFSREEMRRRLIEKGETPETAAECAEWLERIGLIDDKSYAESVVRHYAAKGYGEGRVRLELRRRGLDRELSDAVLADMPDQDEHVLKFIRARLHDPSDRAQVKKVADALFRRGYSWDEIRRALNEFAQGE